MSVKARQRGGWSLAFIVIVVVSLVPVVWIVMLSLKTPASATDGSFIPHHWTLSNYRDIFNANVFTSALINSIGIALISSALAVVFASSAAYAIARLDFPGKQVILAVALMVTLFPQVSLVGPLYNLWRQIGLFNTWPGLIIPYLTFALPLAIFVLSTFFREIPWELEQAAQIDGATPFQAFRKVIAPLAMPGIVTTFIPDLLERLRVRDLPDGHLGGRDRAGGHRAVPRRVAVHATDRRHRRGCGCRHRTRHGPRHPVPASYRGRPDSRRRQGIRRSRTWPTSHSSTSQSATTTASRPCRTSTSRSPTASS
jgi:ABC-type glycerol-3-phosphate transport system permease component